MTLMAEPVPAADDPVGLNRAETVAVPNYPASDTGDRTSPHDYGDATSQSEAAPDRQSWRATWGKAGALLAGCLALAGAIVLAFWLLTPPHQGFAAAAWLTARADQRRVAQPTRTGDGVSPGHCHVDDRVHARSGQ